MLKLVLQAWQAVTGGIQKVLEIITELMKQGKPVPKHTNLQKYKKD